VGVASDNYGGEERCVQGLMGKPDGERLLGRYRHSWGDDIKMDIPKYGSACTGLIGPRIGISGEPLRIW